MANSQPSKRSRDRGARRSHAGIVARIHAGDNVIPVRGTQALQQFALRWAYLIRNRVHWDRSERSRIRGMLYEQLKTLGFDSDALHKFSGCSYVEVEIPYQKEEIGWEARIVPWEFILSQVAEGLCGSEPPLVVRWLNVRRRQTRQTHPQDRLLYVEAYPGPLARHFDCENESQLVFSSLEQWAKDGRYRLHNPTLHELGEAVERNRARVVHVTGVDNHQGLELLSGSDEPVFDHDGNEFRYTPGLPVFDGLCLRGSERTKRVTIEPTLEVARALGGGKNRPSLVGLNMYHSGPRIAAMTVAMGAQAAVGFQDTVDDAVAELFFNEFYRAWVDKKEDPRGAMELALTGLTRAGANREGSGIVVWSDRSLATPAPPPPARKERTAPRTVAVQGTSTGTGGLPRRLELTVKVRETVNYSLLHNRESLFSKLLLGNLTGKLITGVKVTADLQLGEGSQPQCIFLDVPPPGVDLRSRLTFPLLSPRMRRWRESVRTTLRVQVQDADIVVADQSESVLLLPMNEWADTNESRQWLPSFVQPQDSAVLDILQAAERHLRSITDDPWAGFDGYQQVDSRHEASCEVVDQQVRAIWTALLQDFNLAYVNPPPSYTKGSQRIRTPREILDSRRGTCLDLTILLASCLEHVDIRAVLFLLEGHAFPGYWRGEHLYEDFWGSVDEAFHDAPMAGDSRSQAPGPYDDQQRGYSWMLKASGYSRVLAAIASDKLRPFEAVWMTAKRSFEESCEAGGENLVNREEFTCLLDVHKARENEVLPLPEKE